MCYSGVMSETTSPVAVRTYKTRGGKPVATITVTFPDGTTATVGGARAARAERVMVGEVILHEVKTTITPQDDGPDLYEYETLRSYWEWRSLGVRADAFDAAKAAMRFAAGRSYRNVGTVPIIDA